MEWLMKNGLIACEKSDSCLGLEFSNDLPFHLIRVERDCIDFIVLFAMGIVRRFYSFVKAFFGEAYRNPGEGIVFMQVEA
jgi:hypothetical protein